MRMPGRVAVITLAVALAVANIALSLLAYKQMTEKGLLPTLSRNAPSVAPPMSATWSGPVVGPTLAGALVEDVLDAPDQYATREGKVNVVALRATLAEGVQQHALAAQRLREEVGPVRAKRSRGYEARATELELREDAQRRTSDRLRGTSLTLKRQRSGANAFGVAARTLVGTVRLPLESEMSPMLGAYDRGEPLKPMSGRMAVDIVLSEDARQALARLDAQASESAAMQEAVAYRLRRLLSGKESGQHALWRAKADGAAREAMRSVPLEGSVQSQGPFRARLALAKWVLTSGKHDLTIRVAADGRASGEMKGRYKLGETGAQVSGKFTGTQEEEFLTGQGHYVVVEYGPFGKIEERGSFSVVGMASGDGTYRGSITLHPDVGSGRAQRTLFWYPADEQQAASDKEI